MHKAIGLPTSRRVGPSATGWRARPRPGRLAGGRLELAQLGSRELCGLAGGPQGSLKHLRALTPAAGSCSACQRWVLEGKSEGSDGGGGCEAGCGLRGGSRQAMRCHAGLRALDGLVCYPRPRLYTDMTSAYPYGRCMAGFLATSRAQVHVYQSEL